jgi:hypothetical protein
MGCTPAQVAQALALSRKDRVVAVGVDQHARDDGERQARIGGDPYRNSD